MDPRRRFLNRLGVIVSRRRHVDRNQLAGYSWLEARYAKRWENSEEMAKQKEKLVNGLVVHGMKMARRA